MTARQISRRLHRNHPLFNPLIFRLTAHLEKMDQRLQAGEYRFEKGSTMYSILKEIKNGEVYQRAFTIIEGWTFYRVMQAFHQDSEIKQTLVHKTPQDIAKQLKIKHQTPEGLLMPDTYFYTKNSTDLDVLKRAHQEMLDYLSQVWQKREKNLPYSTPYKTLIVASMIEKETAMPQERSLVADVIRKRLIKWMPLQIDATVIYGLKRYCNTKKDDKFCHTFSGRLTPRGIAIKTPYNTYKHYGLPSTPIAMPSRASIDAALHPKKTPYYYYVANQDGTHDFSETLEQHRQRIVD